MTESAAGPAPLGRVKALDGLRGAAIGVVIVHHFWQGRFPGGGVVGVDLFFGLSGFLITSLLLAEHDGSGRISLRRFYLRRALRLYPALYAMLAAYLVFMAAGGGGTSSLGDALEGAGFVSVYVFNWAKAAGVRLPTELGPLWTLSVEEQFYFLWPLALLLLLRLRRPPRVLARVTAAGVLALWALRPLLWLRYGSSPSYYFTSTWADTLLAGALLAISRQYGLFPGVRRYLSAGPVVALSLAVLTAGVFIPALKGQAALYWVLLPVFCVAIVSCVIAAVERPAMRIVRVASIWPIVATGVISYSLYLYSDLVRELLSQRRAPAVVVGGIPLAFALAVASRFLVERPALRLKGRFEPARVAGAGGARFQPVAGPSTARPAVGGGGSARGGPTAQRRAR